MYLGIEIGGTKLQLGVGDGNGKILSLWRDRVDVGQGGDGIRRQIEAAVPTLLKRADLQPQQIQSAGVGFGGPVDDATRRVIKSHQIDGWDDFPLGEWLEDVLHVPVVLGNDCDCAGLAEALFGAGQGASPVFYITIGSGIGGGLIIDCEIYRGAGRGAAEIGHLLTMGRDAGGWQDRIIEHRASGWGIESQAQRILPPREDGHPWTVPTIAEATQAGDAKAKGVLFDAWRHLAKGICHVIALLCPRRIIIGGGVSMIGDALLFNPLREMVRANCFEPFINCWELLPAALGEEVVVHGALALAKGK